MADADEPQSTTEAAAQASEKIQEHPAYRWLVTIGLICYGVVHLLLAWLVVQIALGKGAEASNQGSLAALADLPLGRILVLATGVGMFALALWQVLEAAFGYPWLHGKKLIVRKVASSFRALTYSGIGLVALNLAASGTVSDGDQSAQGTTRDVLNLPGGRWLLALVGLAMLVAAIDQVQRGVRRSFVKYDMEGGVPGWAVKLGIVGWVTKGLTLAIVSFGFLRAAWQQDFHEAGGLDLGIKSLRDEFFGEALILVAALGFAAFGLFCFVWSRYARHDASDT
ncbi:MAG TPA: DUF1206 domain-containing protein [Propionibacteriaceae bacterium]|nr:DUF1206 domain-containing protein [Propionibacteriaceae bacterium]